MSTQVGPPARWARSTEAANAKEILASVKERDGKFRELPDQRVRCDCGAPYRSLVRSFVGEAEEDGSIRHWLLVGERRRGGTGRESIPAQAEAIKKPDEPIAGLIAECPRCKQGWLVVPCEPETAHRLTESALTGFIINTSRPAPADMQPQVGEDVETRAVTEWTVAPLGFAIGRLGTPKQGSVAP